MFSFFHLLFFSSNFRRIKSEVEVSLPPKHELKILVPLAEFQLHMYRSLLLKDFDALTSASTELSQEDFGNDVNNDDLSDLTRSKKRADHVVASLVPVDDETKSEWKRLQSLLMQLRKTCNHPYLFAGADPNPNAIDDGIVEASNKMALLDRYQISFFRLHQSCSFRF